jgi:hypothetical protein
MSTARMLVVILLAVLALPASAESAQVISAGSRVSGSVEDRDTPAVYGAFELDSESLGRPDLTGSADDPGGTAESDAEVDFQIASVAGGERLTAQGGGSARSGLPVRESLSTSNVTAEFTLTAPASYSASGTLSGSNAAGQCCRVSSARLTGDDGNVFNTVVSQGQAPKNVASSGTLPPGDYQLVMEASPGFGFGAAASDTSGSAAFDVTFTLTLPGADMDGDALPDGWETDGVDVDGNGTIDLDLPGMGADPRHKDVFLELDYMPPHRYAQQAAALVVDAFADAPVANPDGHPGITLHLDNGSDSVMNPKTGATWGSRSRQNQLVHQDVLGTVVGDEYDWSAFDALRDTSFEAARRTAFHYAISAHGHDGRVSGVARGIPSADLLVTLGAGCAHLNAGVDCTLGPMAQAGTLMHELGHGLGLSHGGNDVRLNKPNYLSVMNYSFQLTGLQTAAGERFLDFSRFGLQTLDESTLDESRGLGVPSGAAADLLTVGHCPGGTRVSWPVKEGPVDFDCSGAASGFVAADINGSGDKTPLTSFVDWPALVFSGGGIGGSGATVPARTPADEPELDELLSAQAALDAALPKPSPPVVTPGAGAGAGSGSTPPPAGTATVKARLTALAVRPGSFRAGRGARVSYTLTAPARVRFTVERLLSGHRRGGRCRAGGRGPRCIRAVRVRGAFSHQGRTGANSVRLPARLGGRRLRAGRYRLTATPVGGTATRAPFRVR